MTPAEFDVLPFITEGNSKVVRYIGHGVCAIKLKPTIYSYTYNRVGEVAGTDTIRLRAASVFTRVLKEAGVDHAYLSVDGCVMRSGLAIEMLDDNFLFRPTDMTDAAFLALPQIPPIEVIVKGLHTGTPKHRYHGIERRRTRTGGVIRPEEEFYTPSLIHPGEAPYRFSYVRYDWRNPNEDETGKRLCDEVMPDELAELYIRTHAARNTANAAFTAINDFLIPRGIEMVDVCFIISQDGRTILSEVSPDCGRFRQVDDGMSLDKDVWRRGGTSEMVIEKWQKILERIM